MATDTAPEFDLGPLSWVQGEIDQALTRGIEGLAAFKAAPQDSTALKHARAHIHQAAGAIQMVGLDAVTAYTDEIERQLQRLEELAPPEAQASCELIDRACRKLKIFLDELVGGAVPVPLKLFPEYELMQQARGAKAAAPTDLFYPDLSPRAPRIANAKSVTPQKLQSYLVKQRRLFQRGLLAWLRGDEEGARVMRDAVQGIEDVQTHSAQRAFWWAVGALLEGIVEKGVESGFGVKQLCGRVDLQIRRFVEGSAKVADRMRREVLYFVAISAPVGPQVQAVQRAYRLQGLIPTADVLSADVVRVQPRLREARDLLATAKDLWLKLTGGRAENLPKLKQTLSTLRDKSAAIGEPSLSKLASALASRLDQLSSGAIPEGVAMEYATGLLLAESLVENFASLSPEVPKQVDTMIARLDPSKPATQGAAPVLDEMARRAQERLLLAQVAREIQANLRHMEQVLDAFFRDHDKRADLASLAHDSKQIMGALRILGLGHAEQLLTLCQQQIDEYAKPETAVANVDLELLAESLSGLGFYIEAVEQQRPDRERLIEPLLAKRLGVPAKPRVDEHDTVEAAVADVKAALPATLAAFQRSPGEHSVRERLAAELTTLKNDAELLGDTQLQTDAEAALDLLTRAGTGDTAALQEAIAAIAGGELAAPAPPSEETLRLLETDASQLDAELLDIYLTEADEVIDSVATNAAALMAQPDDREALITVRRGFHTLKGSGRMVGLTELGEIAYEVEKVHNRMLEDDLPVTPAVLSLIDVAQTSFRVWVDTLRRKHRVTPDATALRAAIAKVEAEFPPPPASAMSAPEAPPPVMAVIQPAAPAMAPDIEVIELDETPLAEAGAMAETGASGSAAEIIEFMPRAAPIAPPATPGPAVSALAPEPEEVTIGDVMLSTALYRILCDEAQQHLSTLDAELHALEFSAATTPSQAMVRAAHTLCGIHRTGGFPLLATVAKALEQCLLGLEERGPPLPSRAQPVLARAVAGLRTLADRVRSRAVFGAADEAEAGEIVAELDALRQEATPASTADDSESLAARAAAEEEAQSPPPPPAPQPPSFASSTLEVPFIPVAAPSGAAARARAAAPVAIAPVAEVKSMAAAKAATTAPAADETLSNVHDDVDEQVLPIFLDEAAELFPQAGEQLRAWQRNPANLEAAQALRRTLHTFKGSARMAGAMRLGELTHWMESRLLAGDVPAAATPELFDVLDTDLDRLAFVLDRLQKREFNSSLPWLEPEMAPASGTAPVVPVAPPLAAVPTAGSPAPRPTAAAPEVCRRTGGRSRATRDVARARRSYRSLGQRGG